MSGPYLSAALRRLHLVIMESYQTLVYWGPRLGRAQTEIESIRKQIDQLDETHPHWARPDMDEVAINVKVLVLLPIAAAIDALFLSPTADYAAKVFFPNQSFLALLARILVPLFMVWIEATLGVLIHNAEETPKWDGSRREYRFLTAIGYGFVLVTPLLVVATFFAASARGETQFPLLAFVFALFAAVLHLAVLKSGRWIRQAIGWFAFTFRRKRLCLREKAVQKRYDKAAESILVAYPAFQSSSNQFMRALPNDGSVVRELPEGVDEAVRLLFKARDDHQLSLSFNHEPSIPRITQDSEAAQQSQKEISL